MGITIKAHSIGVPKYLGERAIQVLQEEVAPALGLFFVKQIEYSHEVQGRDEEDRQGVWPPRQVASSGLIVFGERRAVMQAIKQLKIKDKKTFFIARDEKAAKKATSVDDAFFTRRQVQGAKLAIEREQERKRYAKKAKGLAGHSDKHKQQMDKRNARAGLILALAEGKLVEAGKFARRLQIMAATISKGRSYKSSVNYLPRPVLTRTGAMRSSWTFRVVRENDLVMILVGTNIAYARHHELGEGVPQRKQFVITRQDRQVAADIASDIMNKSLLR